MFKIEHAELAKWDQKLPRDYWNVIKKLLYGTGLKAKPRTYRNGAKATRDLKELINIDIILIIMGDDNALDYVYNSQRV